jgi:hypothetical protein
VRLDAIETALVNDPPRFIAAPLWRRLLGHPQEDRFAAARFERKLEEAGLRVLASRALWDRFGWVTADREVP